MSDGLANTLFSVMFQEMYCLGGKAEKKEIKQL